MLTLILVCAVVVVVLHLAARWVRARCKEIDWGLAGPQDTAPTASS